MLNLQRIWKEKSTTMKIKKKTLEQWRSKGFWRHSHVVKTVALTETVNLKSITVIHLISCYFSVHFTSFSTQEIRLFI
jgi:hypothetical protein